MNKKTVCVDLDGTLATYNGWKGADHIGDPRPGAGEFLGELYKVARVVIYTTRTNCDDPALGRDSADTPESLAERIRNWLDKNGLPYDEVYTGKGKPFCAAFVDDRAVAIPTNPGEGEFRVALGYVKQLLG